MENEKQINEESVFKFLSPEEADQVILNRLELARPKNRKKGDGNNVIKWKKFEIQIRRQVIIDLIRQGLSQRRVKEEIMNRWHICEDASWRYYNDALESMMENRDEYIKHNREIQVERIEGMLEDCLAKGDYKSAIKAQDLLNKIGGLYIENHNVDVSGDISFEFGSEE